MHTDEYEISLRRELAVCEAAVGRLVRRLDAASGAERESLEDGLAAWEQRRREYLSLLERMRI